MSVTYDPSRPHFPDCSEYHPVTDWKALVAALGPTKLLGFKVGNGDLNDPMSDPFFGPHLKGAEANGLIALGYWWGPMKVDSFLKAFPPKEGRIPCLDFEGSHLVADLASAFATKIHSEWGRWPWFYGHSTWIAHGKAGTAIENCPYWGPTYGNTLTIPAGVGKPAAHQYAASSRGPMPQHFPGVRPYPTGTGPDMNSLLIPFEEVRRMAGLNPPPPPPPPPGGNVLTDDDAKQLGYTHVGDWRVQQDRSKAASDVLLSLPKRTGQSGAYALAYDKMKAKLG